MVFFFSHGSCFSHFPSAQRFYGYYFLFIGQKGVDGAGETVCRSYKTHVSKVLFFLTTIICIKPFNPLSPNIHIQILQTDLPTFPLRISYENLIKDQSIFSSVIILLILITSSRDNVWILLGENCCWSLLGLRGLNHTLD